MSNIKKAIYLLAVILTAFLISDLSLNSTQSVQSSKFIFLVFPAGRNVPVYFGSGEVADTLDNNPGAVDDGKKSVVCYQLSPEIPIYEVVKFYAILDEISGGALVSLVVSCTEGNKIFDHNIDLEFIFERIDDPLMNLGALCATGCSGRLIRSDEQLRLNIEDSKYLLLATMAVGLIVAYILISQITIFVFCDKNCVGSCSSKTSERNELR